jgi:aromatic-amino-acid transaminase
MLAMILLHHQGNFLANLVLASQPLRYSLHTQCMIICILLGKMSFSGGLIEDKSPAKAVSHLRAEKLRHQSASISPLGKKNDRMADHVSAPIPDAHRVFAHIPTAPDDPILGLTESFRRDPRPQKVNLGVGVYQDDAGVVPLLGAVRKAEERLISKSLSRSYLAIEGHATFRERLQRLVFGETSTALAEGRIVSAQTIAGSGALRLGADLLVFANPGATIYISDPSWANHQAIFERAGLKVASYPYFDPATKALHITAMLETLNHIPEGSIVLLHACCHNPSGVDPSREQWQQIADVLASRNAVAFIDMAYQGFGDGPHEDAYAVRLFAERGIPLFVSTSCSKNFGLYAERVGLLSFVANDAHTAHRMLTQWKRLIRGNYSSPPFHGASIVAEILSDQELEAEWISQLAEMRTRIKEQRGLLAAALGGMGLDSDFSFIVEHRGMFTYTGFTEQVVDRLRDEHGIYMVRSGRMCVAALNNSNIDYVAESIAATLRATAR